MSLSRGSQFRIIAGTCYSLCVVFLLTTVAITTFAGCGGGSSGGGSAQTTMLVTLEWEAPTKDADGSALEGLAGYWVYWGNASGMYNEQVKVGKVESYTVRLLQEGTFYFAVTACDEHGNQSNFSNEVSATVTDQG